MSDPSAPWIALQVVMMPKDANPNISLTTFHAGGQYPLYSTIFGGVILSHIDLAGAVAARREVQLRGGNPAVTFVTVAINRVEFKQPVHVGDVVRFQTTLVRLGRTSVTFAVNVIAERGAVSIPVTDAEVVYVAVTPNVADPKPVPIMPEPSPG